MELYEVLRNNDNYKLDKETEKIKLVGTFSSESLKHVKVLTYKNDDCNKKVEFLTLLIAPALFSAIIIDFTTNKQITKDVDRNDLIDYLVEKEFENSEEEYKFIYGSILEKEIIDIYNLYPAISVYYGDKEEYAAEEVEDTINQIRKSYEVKTKQPIKVKVRKRK